MVETCQEGRLSGRSVNRDDSAGRQADRHALRAVERACRGESENHRYGHGRGGKQVGGWFGWCRYVSESWAGFAGGSAVVLLLWRFRDLRV